MIHHDIAKQDTVAVLRQALQDGKAQRFALIDDVHGSLRVLAWSPVAQDAQAALATALAGAGGPYSQPITVIDPERDPAAQHMVAQLAMTARYEADEKRLMLCERYRNRGAWFRSVPQPLWSTVESDLEGPPIISFYSFKGGVGRTTNLAAFAIQRAQAGDRVVVIDGDLDAPGLGALLTPDPPTIEARYGVVDYLMESIHGTPDIDDFLQYCHRPALASHGGSIAVMPAGLVSDNYLGRLARVDLEPDAEGRAKAWTGMIRHIRDALDPQWILCDTRPGLGDAAGGLLSGLAHLQILCGLDSEQSWRGIELVIRRLGRERLLQELPNQADCLLVQTMIAAESGAADEAMARFRQRSEQVFQDGYYAESESADADERLWTVADLDTSDAPHVPVAIPYHPGIPHAQSLDRIAPILQQGPWAELGRRILARWKPGESP